eukprot:RCo013880
MMGVPLWSLGVLLNVAGSLAINLSANLLKFSHRLQKKRRRRRRRLNLPLVEPEPLSPEALLWGSSVTLFAAGNLLSFASFAYAAQSLLAALGSVQFLSNVVFAAVLLQEHPTAATLGGTLVVTVGNALAVVSFS